jgi:hypothetical protein
MRSAVFIHVLALTGLVFAEAAVVEAQAAGPTYEIGGGFRRVESMSLGARDANETTGAGGEFRLFRSESQFDALHGFEARFGSRVTDRIWVSLVGSFGQTNLTVQLSDDVEDIPDVTVSESIRQFTFEGEALVHVPRWRAGMRTAPFLSAGVGYVRHLHENETLAEQGLSMHTGVGVNVALGAPRASGGAGLRFDVRLVLLSRGAALDDDLHAAPSFGVSAFTRF